jgi:UDP-N-acetylglucosamine acyltransferase
VIGNLKKAYKIIFRSGLTQDEAFKKAVEAFPNSKEVNYFVDFMRNSKRGVTR